jgi:DNA gyrase subunit A
MVAVKSGRAIRFPEEKVRPTGRGAIGVMAIEVDDTSDEVVGMICVNKQQAESNTVLVVSEQGFGKKTKIDEYRITNRGGKGIKTIHVTERTGALVGILDVTETDDLMITCKSGITIRTGTSTIREAGRNTQGVKLIRLEADDEIAAITKLDKFEEEEDETLENVEGQPEADITEEASPESSAEATEDNLGESENPEEPVQE